MVENAGSAVYRELWCYNLVRCMHTIYEDDDGDDGDAIN